jgi:hypothetical protein
MEFVEVMKHKQRMCRTIGACKYCPLSSSNNRTSVICGDVIKEYPERAEEIIIKWAKEHTAKTNKQVFIEIMQEKFGDIFNPNKLYSMLDNYCCVLFNRDCDGNCKTCDQNKFWDKEYEEVNKDESGN